MEQIPPPPVTATRTQSPYPPSYRNRSSATHFNVTLDNTPLRFPHRISAGLTRVQDICYLAIPGFRPPLAIHKLLYINFDTEPHPLSHTTCELQQILQALFYSWKSLILRYTAPVNTTSASSFMLNMRHSMPQSPEAWGQWHMHYLSCFYKWRQSATFPALRFTANGQINKHWKNRLCLLQSAFFLVWQLKLNLTAAGLAQSVERLTAEQEVAGSIPGAGPILRVLK